MKKKVIVSGMFAIIFVISCMVGTHASGVITEMDDFINVTNAGTSIYSSLTKGSVFTIHNPSKKWGLYYNIIPVGSYSVIRGTLDPGKSREIKAEDWKEGEYTLHLNLEEEERCEVLHTEEVRVVLKQN